MLVAPGIFPVQVAPAVAALVIHLEAQRGNARVKLEAHPGRRCVRGMAARVTRMIHIEALWLSVAPLDMLTSMDTLLMPVEDVFGELQ